jgi:hypothetical protein
MFAFQVLYIGTFHIRTFSYKVFWGYTEYFCPYFQSVLSCLHGYIYWTGLSSSRLLKSWIEPGTTHSVIRKWGEAVWMSYQYKCPWATVEEPLQGTRDWNF